MEASLAALQRRRELAQRDALLLLVALDRVGDARELGGELLAGAQQLEPVGLNAALASAWISPELLAVGVLRQHGQLRLRVPQRHLLALERDALGQHAVLELVLALDERRRDEPALARLAQAVEQLALVALGALLGLAQRLELLEAEQSA